MKKEGTAFFKSVKDKVTVTPGGSNTKRGTSYPPKVAKLVCPPRFLDKCELFTKCFTYSDVEERFSRPVGIPTIKLKENIMLKKQISPSTSEEEDLMTANPAMKSAVKTVKDVVRMKTAYKGWRSKLKRQPRASPTSKWPRRGDKPRSAPNSPTGKRRTLA
ncbi:hypothetical protein NQ317_014281 [Molorchus minor]|uniref:Uncharacterized protein n=1 Tax=Molorchus minor TaxID=1323400 RepID=A0ABQ9IU88_9CUCU|nr:hypothetical protein NQ317_014281 [Molorchus minor]